MDTIQIVNDTVVANGGIAKTSDFIAQGINAKEIIKLCNEGFLTRVRQGYYQLASNSYTSEEQMIKTLIPEGVVCMESALFHYEYSDFTPRKWSIAVPRTISRKKLEIDGVSIQTYYVQKSLYGIGKTEDVFSGVNLSVYDRERTICDCFKFRSRLDSETFNKALNAYANDEKKNLGHLSDYAKRLRVYNKVMELMGVLLNG
ncbi:MAG: type IV toxin-antitoxin system AbiEi family antitoxin domain-containing protein [Ruminococcus sp.]|nr:type IV toxin-antitoxin system AbiEi family antitoxin domain-containing protein [Ruminococcus sp.]